MTRKQNKPSAEEEEEEEIQETNEESQAIEAFVKERSIEEENKQEGDKRAKTMKVESRKVIRIAHIQSKNYHTVTAVEVWIIQVQVTKPG